MGTAFNDSVQTTAGSVQAKIKELILKSSDWAHLQLTTGTQNTTLSSGASAAATSISTAATIPSGSLVVIGNGAANPECRITTGVSGSGPYTVTFAEPLVNGYSSGAGVGVGFYCKATTTRGAQMVIDLNDASVNTQRVVVGVYRTHDGTTGVDKVTRYIHWKENGGASTDSVYVTVSAGKEHLFIYTEGPRPGQSNADSSQYGSMGHSLALCDIVPYFAGDTIPAVALVGSTQDTVSPTEKYAYTSRDQADASSWVPGVLLSLCQPGYNDAGPAIQYQMLAKGDGNTYLFPYVMCETEDGIRGRLSDVYYGGCSKPRVGEDVGGYAIGAEVTYNSKTYKMVRSVRARVNSGTTVQSGWGIFQYDGNGSNICPLIAVPK